MSYAKSALAKKATPRKNQKTLVSAGKSNYQVSRATQRFQMTKIRQKIT
jgi:hypothetical protein